MPLQHGPWVSTECRFSRRICSLISPSARRRNEIWTWLRERCQTIEGTYYPIAILGMRLSVLTQPSARGDSIPARQAKQNDKDFGLAVLLCSRSCADNLCCTLVGTLPAYHILFTGSGSQAKSSTPELPLSFMTRA
jgi:hypothetical protein